MRITLTSLALVLVVSVLGGSASAMRAQQEEVEELSARISSSIAGVSHLADCFDQVRRHARAPAANA